MNHYTLAEMTPGLSEEFTVTVTPVAFIGTHSHSQSHLTSKSFDVSRQ